MSSRPEPFRWSLGRGGDLLWIGRERCRKAIRPIHPEKPMDSNEISALSRKPAEARSVFLRERRAQRRRIHRSGRP